MTYRYTGFSHHFYEYGETYNLVVWRTLFRRIRIEIHHGHDDKAWGASQESYRNWKAFNKDWTEVRETP